MQRFFAVAALILLAAVSTQAMKCYRCSDEKSCQNPETVNCSDDLGCQKLTNTKPYLYSKGCFNPIGSALVGQNQCKDAKIGDIEGNYCRCNDKELCNSAFGNLRYSFGVLALGFLSLLVARV